MEGRLKRDERRFPETIRTFAPEISEIYYRGDISLCDRCCIAVVGSRKCTEYGRAVARSIGHKLGENGVVLVSGLAKGIDTEGHRGVLEAGGKTIAVLGGGYNYYYPRENRRLQDQIAEEGLLLSEHEPDYKPRGFDFPKRNRIISALTQSIVVVEAKNRSGALITAECSEEMGKNVYAVPGNITSFYSFGTNKLIRENAKPLILLDDLLTDLNIEPYIMKETLSDLGSDEKKVLDIIVKSGEITAEEIHNLTKIRTSEVNGIITVLEMKGLVFSSMGKVFIAKF